MDWQNLLRGIVPTLAAAAGGPLAATAASFIAAKLGLESKTIEAVADVLNSGKLTPEQITSIKQAEVEFQKFLKNSDIKLEEIAAGDRDSAREAFKITRSNMPAVLTCILGTGFFVVLGAMFVFPEVKESTPLMIMLGVLGSEFSGSCKFWFGTTSNSKDKTAMLANSQPAK